MSNNILLVACVFLWGFSTFLQKLSADRMSPVLGQMVVGFAFLAYIPVAIKMMGGWESLKWNPTSIAITVIATFVSIVANILLYTVLSNSKHTGSSVMIVSLYPAVTLLLSATFLHEHFSFGKVVGILIMIAGAVLLTWC